MPARVVLVDDAHAAPHEDEPCVLNAEVIADESEFATQADPLARHAGLEVVGGLNQPPRHARRVGVEAVLLKRRREVGLTR